jgi:ERCC4-type nuclease
VRDGSLNRSKTARRSKEYQAYRVPRRKTVRWPDSYSGSVFPRAPLPSLAAGLAGLTILVDSRERYPYKFTQQQATTERQALPAGDYAVAHDSEIVAVVERKSLADLVHRLVDGRLTYALADMATIPRAAVVIEDRYSSLFKLEHIQPGFVTEMLAALTVRYPTVPIHFAETRPLAEEWTYRFLGAALAYSHAADGS